MKKSRGGQVKTVLGTERRQLNISVATDMLCKIIDQYLEAGYMPDADLDDALIDRPNDRLTKLRRTFARKQLEYLVRMRPVDHDDAVVRLYLSQGPLIRQPSTKGRRSHYYYLNTAGATPLELELARGIHQRLAKTRSDSDRIKTRIWKGGCEGLNPGQTIEDYLKDEGFDV